MATGPQAPDPAQAPAAPANDASEEPRSPGDALRGLSARFAELAEYIAYLFAVRVDRIKLSLRHAWMYAVLGILCLAVLGALVVTAVVLLCRGLAGALAALFGGHAWAGDLAAAVLLLGLIFGAGWMGKRRLDRRWRERTVIKYASRQQHQRATFGTDIHERARDGGK